MGDRKSDSAPDRLQRAQDRAEKAHLAILQAVDSAVAGQKFSEKDIATAKRTIVAYKAAFSIEVDQIDRIPDLDLRADVLESIVRTRRAIRQIYAFLAAGAARKRTAPAVAKRLEKSSSDWGRQRELAKELGERAMSEAKRTKRSLENPHSLAVEILPTLEKACKKEGIPPPKIGTVAKYLKSMFY